MSSFSEFCRTVTLFSFFLDLEHVALYVGLYRCFLVFVNLVQEEVECLREVDRRCPHFDSPLMAFLLNHSVRRKVVCCLV